MRRLVAAIALAGGLIGGGVGVPLVLTAQPASAAPDVNRVPIPEVEFGPWLEVSPSCFTEAGHPGFLYLDQKNGSLHCFER
jgi:hypothetical protein